jgi:hypothetical protein
MPTSGEQAARSTDRDWSPVAEWDVAPRAADRDEVVARLLPEREHVRLGARFAERNLERPLADRVVRAHELVQAADPEHAVAVLVDLTPWERPGASPSRSKRKGIGPSPAADSTRCASRAWNR